LARLVDNLGSPFTNLCDDFDARRSGATRSASYPHQTRRNAAAATITTTSTTALNRELTITHLLHESRSVRIDRS
jgi:hypothetical protein